MEQRRIGRRKANYRLHDWLISRQRYWGTPIPIIYCSHCGIVPVPESDLPVRLPEDAEFLPTGESPLKLHEGFRRTRCPQCGGEAERETDTMDTFIDSAWYEDRYVSPHDPKRPFDPEGGRYWLPVDQHTGGGEHAVIHLLFTRFWPEVMGDLGMIGFGEPRKHKAQGRAPEARQSDDGHELQHWTHKTIKNVTEDLEGFHFNTAIAALMEFVNYMYKMRDEQAGTAPWREANRSLVLLLAPITPHIAEELWASMGESYSIHQQGWPSYDATLARAELVTLVLQVDGKVRDRIQIPSGLTEAKAKEMALHNEKVRRFMDGRQVTDIVVVPGRLVNVVTK